MAEQLYEVLKEGIVQRTNGDPNSQTWSYPELGDIIRLSESAAEHFMTEGYVKPAVASARLSDPRVRADAQVATQEDPAQPVTPDMTPSAEPSQEAPESPQEPVVERRRRRRVDEEAK